MFSNHLSSMLKRGSVPLLRINFALDRYLGYGEWSLVRQCPMFWRTRGSPIVKAVLTAAPNRDRGG